jgi:hypothetical protein
VSLVVGTVLACSSIREDEFLCENAVSHLKACCPAFQAAIACNYVQGCDESTYPDLDLAQSNCILDQPCDILRRNGVCESVAQLPDGGLEGGAAAPPVCTQPSALLDGGRRPGGDGGMVGPVAGCTSASDCKVPGDVCCFVGIDLNCAPFPCRGGGQVCASAPECGPGMTCEFSSAVSGLGLCAPVDASAEAIHDAPAIAPDASADSMTDAPAIAPDATDARSNSDASSSDAGFTGPDAVAESDASVDGSGP